MTRCRSLLGFACLSILAFLGATSADAQPDYKVRVEKCVRGETTKVKVSVENVGTLPGVETTTVTWGVTPDNDSANASQGITSLNVGEKWTSQEVEIVRDSCCFGNANKLTTEINTSNNRDQTSLDRVEDGLNSFIVPAANPFQVEITLDLAHGPLPPGWTLVSLPEQITIQANSETSFAVEIDVTDASLPATFVVTGTSVSPAWGTWDWDFIATGPVPALGPPGLVVISVVLLALGLWMMQRRHRSAPSRVR